MRFAHRRSRNEGEFASETGGFWPTPPATPPHTNPPPNKDLPTRRGELGGFSLPLHVEGSYQARRRGYVDHPGGARAVCTSTPPATDFSLAKSRQQHKKSDGGVFGESPPVATRNHIQAAYDLPADIVAGLRMLERQPAPVITRPEVWSEVVSDALNLALHGCVRRAINLGWDTADIFGVGVSGSDAFEGLAIWLAGREVILLDAQFAIAADGERRALFTRGGLGRGRSPVVTPVLLWEFGRG